MMRMRSVSSAAPASMLRISIASGPEIRSPQDTAPNGPSSNARHQSINVRRVIPGSE
jgi:hypothetical protein